MAHEVSAKLHTKVVAHKDLEIEVKTINGGKLNRPGYRGGSNPGEWSHEEVPEVFP